MHENSMGCIKFFHFLRKKVPVSSLLSFNYDKFREVTGTSCVRYHFFTNHVTHSTWLDRIELLAFECALHTHGVFDTIGRYFRNKTHKALMFIGKLEFISLILFPNHPRRLLKRKCNVQYALTINPVLLLKEYK